MRRSVLRSVVAALVLAVGPAGGLLPAPAAHAAPAPAHAAPAPAPSAPARAGAPQAPPPLSPVTLPGADRWEGHRGAHVLAAGTTGVLLSEEQADGTRPCRWHPATGVPVPVPCAGSVTMAEVDGALLVAEEPGGADSGLALRTLRPGEEQWQPYAAPAGATVVSPVGEGVLLQQADGALVLQPWGSDAAVPVTGLPAGLRVHRAAAWTAWPASDATGVLTTDSSGGRWLVEAAQRRALPLPEHPLALGGDSVLLAVYGSDGARSGLATRRRPATAHDPLGEALVRPAPARTRSSDARLLPVGDDVVLSLAGQGLRSEQLPVAVLDASGGQRELLPWALGVRPAPGAPGSVLAVTGPAAGDRAVTVTPVAGGAPVPQVALSALPARPAAVALDHDRLLVVDDSERDGALVEVPLSGGVPDPARRRVLATGTRQSPVADCDRPWVPSCRLVVAGGGATAYGARSGVHVVLPDGSTRRVEAAWDPASVDGRYVVGSLGTVTRLSDGSIVPPLQEQEERAVADGVAYAARRRAPGQLLTRDLDSGATAVVGLGTAAGGCAVVDAPRPVDVAGSWLLARRTCAGPVLVDLAGGRAPQPRSDVTELGNGFGARLVDGSLTWTDLSDPTAAHTPVADRVTAVGVTTGQGTPALAWVAGGRVHVAPVPVTPTPPAPRPTEVLAAPAPPQLAVLPGNGAVTVHWSDPDRAQRVDSWRLQLDPGGQVATVSAGSPRYWTFPFLTNGRPYTVSATANNRVGTSAAASGGATPLGPPPVPTGLAVTVEPDTGWPP